ncbi:MAG: SDR family oxidoreductase [Bacteroidetes bacterium]|nr:SDR family oxidoreductase [Bacteroidota bacterium]MBM3424635.1 SDR family oxidoreductase [Bacteroidota bacterium]
MKKYVIVGASSALAQATKNQLISDGNWVIQLSRNPSFSDFELTDYVGELPAIDQQIDGLVYFPGTINLKPFRSLKLEDFQTDFNIHVLGAVNALKTYQSQMNEGSSVVLISSVAATTGMPFHASVAAVKAALEGLGRSLAAEWAPKIRVNVVAPSLTITPMAERLINTPEKIEAGAQRHPMKRLGSPEDFASCISFLLSDQSSWITGQVLPVDGGMGKLKV